MFLVKWVPIFSKQTWILAKSSHFIESPFSLEHKISRKKRSDRHFRCFCGEFGTLSGNHFHSAEFPFYREKIAADFVQKFPFYRIPILPRMYCNPTQMPIGTPRTDAGLGPLRRGRIGRQLDFIDRSCNTVYW